MRLAYGRNVASSRQGKVKLNEKLRVRLRRIPELPIHGPSNMNQRSSRACFIIIGERVG